MNIRSVRPTSNLKVAASSPTRLIACRYISLTLVWAGLSGVGYGAETRAGLSVGAYLAAGNLESPSSGVEGEFHMVFADSLGNGWNFALGRFEPDSRNASLTEIWARRTAAFRYAGHRFRLEAGPGWGWHARQSADRTVFRGTAMFTFGLFLTTWCAGSRCIESGVSYRSAVIPGSGVTLDRFVWMLVLTRDVH